MRVLLVLDGDDGRLRFLLVLLVVVEVDIPGADFFIGVTVAGGFKSDSSDFVDVVVVVAFVLSNRCNIPGTNFRPSFDSL